jgi:hypothetical protein
MTSACLGAQGGRTRCARIDAGQYAAAASGVECRHIRQLGNDTAMQTMRIRVVGDEARAEALMNMLHAMDGVAQVEEMPLPRADRGVDGRGNGNVDAVSHLEVAVADGAAHRVRAFTAGAALLMDACAEFVDRFGIDGR